MDKVNVDKKMLENCYDIIKFLEGMVLPSDISDEQKLAINLLMIKLKGEIKK